MTFQCPKCGRFTRATSCEGYDGNFTQVWITTYCTDHGKITQATV